MIKGRLCVVVLQQNVNLLVISMSGASFSYVLLNVTIGYKAVYPEEAIQSHLAFLARRRGCGRR